MTRVGRQFDRRANLVAQHVDAVEMLRQADQLTIVAHVTSAAAAFTVMHIGRSRHQREVDDVAANRHLPGWVARRQGVGRRCRLQRLGDQPAIEPHRHGAVVDIGTSALEQRQRTPVHHLHAEIFQDVQRGQMDRLDLVRRK